MLLLPLPVSAPQTLSQAPVFGAFSILAPLCLCVPSSVLYVSVASVLFVLSSPSSLVRHLGFPFTENLTRD